MNFCEDVRRVREEHQAVGMQSAHHLDDKVGKGESEGCNQGAAVLPCGGKFSSH